MVFQKKAKEEVKEDSIDSEEPRKSDKVNVEYIAIPRAVPNEEMLNLIYDSLQRIEQDVALIKRGIV